MDQVKNVVKCSDCYTIFNPMIGQFCPNCGGGNITVRINDSGIGEDDLDKIKSRTSKTNRITIHADSRNETDSLKLDEMISSYVLDETDDLKSYIENLVNDFNNYSHPSIAETIFYRAVKGCVKLESDHIGPSPGLSSDGRYNIAREQCIYLSDKIEFLFHELDCSSIQVQKYNITLDTLKIANLSPNNPHIDNNLALAFDKAERGWTSSGCCFEDELLTQGKSKYLISQLLSFFFKKKGFNGLYIPGVHGNENGHYHNLVIFGPEVDQWENWVEGKPFKKEKTEVLCLCI